MDSTHKSWLDHPAYRVLVVIVTLAIAGSWLTVEARADGDPASDVLAAQELFLPADAGLSAGQQQQLAALAAEAQRDGYRIRTAVIASPTDLGSVSELWRRPQSYAHFLGQELSLVYRGALLVVMPNGYGVYGVGGIPAAASALHGLPLPGSSLGPAAITAIRRLAGASGHPLPLPIQRTPGSSGSSDPVPWIVFGAGLALIALAWTTSLRARPLGAKEQQASSG